DGSHGWERTHMDSLEATYNLLHAWLQTPLTFAKWDAKPSGKLRDFPSSEQPAPTEQWVPLARGEHAEPGEVSPGSHWPPSSTPEGGDGPSPSARICTRMKQCDPGAMLADDRLRQ